MRKAWIIESSDQVPRAMLLKRFPVPRNFGMAPQSRIAQGRHGQPRPANLHLIEVGDGREAGAGMMIIEKMLPRALGANVLSSRSSATLTASARSSHWRR